MPGFRQFRYPAKLFTFTALGLAALAGWGWDDLSEGRSRRTAVIFFVLFVLTIGHAGGNRAPEGAHPGFVPHLKSPTTLGRSRPARIPGDLRSLAQAAIVFALGLALAVLARKTPAVRRPAALLLTTADLAAANARYVLTVPQTVLETKPEALKIIEDAESALIPLKDRTASTACRPGTQ